MDNQLDAARDVGQFRGLKIRALLLGAIFLPGCGLQAPGNFYPHQSVMTAEAQFSATTRDYDTPPRILSGGAPEYPLAARERHEFGTVIVDCTVGVDGRAHDIEVEKTPLRSFLYPLTQAMREWRWEPARKHGQPVPARVKFRFNFKPVT